MATMFYPIDENMVMLVQKLLDKDGFHDKNMCKKEKNAIEVFIKKLDNPKKYMAHWITKTGDKYEYQADKMPNSEEYEKGYAIDIGAFFAEYIYKVWGDDAVELLRILSLNGMVYLHKQLAHLIVNIMDMTHSHKALVFKLHKIKVEKKIAINKIKRNRIYNMGLGLKLAVKEYSKDF